MARKYKIARYIPDAILEPVLRYVPPREISHITGVKSPTGAQTEGWFIACTLTARQLLHDPPERSTAKILESCKLAASLGADLVGLGAFTAVVGDGGITIADEMDIGVTTGNSYTVATAVEGLLQAARLIGHDTAHSTVAVLGATGSIGSVCAKLLADQVARVVLVGRRQEALDKLAQEVVQSSAEASKCTVETSTDVSATLGEAPLVVAVTSALETVISPHDLLPGAVVCDVARPRDVGKAVADQRADVLVIEGGVVAVPGEVEFNFNFGFPPRTAYACMAETMILALEGHTGDYSLGRNMSLEGVRHIQSLAEKHGFHLAGFRSFEREVDQSTIDRVRELADRAIQTYGQGS
jgi:fatty aldehyde-generating acyl-ACP reductase